MNRQNIDTIIVLLVAIENFAKDIHYNCAGKSFYGNHIFADRINSGLSYFYDNLKETSLRGHGFLTLPSKDYLEQATKLIPDITNDIKQDFEAIKELMVQAIELANNINDGNRADNKILDDISEQLQNGVGLINIMISGDM